MKRPTQIDVARRAGVSRSTVSYVLNDQTELKIPISDETRQRVMDAIAELGYEPDARAQSLRSGSTNIVGVIIPAIQNPFFWQMLSGISSGLQEAGYSLHLTHHPLDLQQEAITIRELTRQPVDGFILLAAAKYLLPRLTNYLRNSGKPVVEITAAVAEFDHVVHTYSDGTRDLMAHLLDLGHQRIGFVYGISKEVQGFDRLLIYREILAAANLTPYEIHCSESLDDAYEAAFQLLNRPDRPTALLVINDMLAVPVMRAAYDLGLTIPDDLSIASFDDIPASKFLVPRLTTVSGKAEESGRVAVQLLLKRFAEPDLLQQVIMTRSELVIRESTGPVKGS
ncbi:MAG: LacI family DNA-binding transcriptional regulator [Anaerolineae bacterium]